VAHQSDAHLTRRLLRGCLFASSLFCKYCVAAAMMPIIGTWLSPIVSCDETIGINGMGSMRMIGEHFAKCIKSPSSSHVNPLATRAGCLLLWRHVEAATPLWICVHHSLVFTRCGSIGRSGFKRLLRYERRPHIHASGRRSCCNSRSAIHASSMRTVTAALQTRRTRM